MNNGAFKNIGAKLKRCRELTFSTATEAANHCGIPKKRFWALERGAYPNAEELEKTCTGLKITPNDWFLDDDEVLIEARLAGLPSNMQLLMEHMTIAGARYARELPE